MINLTKRKEPVFQFIKSYIGTNQTAPTLKEIGSRCSIRSSSDVHAVLVALEKDGLIKRTPNISRGIEIVNQSQGVGWIDR